MLKLIFVRHGNSVSNVSKTFTGHRDEPLSLVGEKQASRVSEFLFKNYKVDKIYSSDLSRAVNTIKEFSNLSGLEIIKDCRLREMFGGQWEGNLFEELPTLFPDDYKVWKDTPGLARPTGGESYEEVQKRIVKFVEDIEKIDDGKTVLISTHGGIIRAFECVIRGVSLERMQDVPYVLNASISVVEVNNGQYKLLQSNLTEYLEELQTAMPKGI